MTEREIFAAVLEVQDTQERSQFLDNICQGDASLRERIAALLAERGKLGNYLEAPAAALAKLDEPVIVPIGSQIGPYKLLEQIGEGGMGLVYMAEQQQPVRRLVALKIVKPGMDSRQVIARFEAERQALAVMDHPNIATVLDAGTTATDRPYFVMELVKGIPITKHCDEHHLPVKQRLELFVTVCQAIQHAHQKGIIHRDIKPTNVLVAHYDAEPVPKVIDFGVAKATFQKMTEKTMFTGFGQLIGTLEYMSPEQARFNQLDIDTRSDVYSLGVLLYELLTGSTPLEQSRLRTAAIDETLRIIRHEEPPKPSTRLSTTEMLPAIAANRNVAPTQLRRQVTGDLDWIVMKCLEKDRKRRYETASSLAGDIQRYLQDEPVHACPPSALYRLQKFAFRNKGSLAVAGGLLLAVAAAAASVGWAIRDRSARESEIARVQSDRRTAMERQVRDDLEMARALVAENKLVLAREKLIQARTQFAADIPGLGNLLTDVEAGQADLNRFQRFLDLIDRANEVETAPVDDPLGLEESVEGTVSAAIVKRDIQRQPAAAVPLLLEALQSYRVLDQDEWQRSFAGGFLAAQQTEQIRRASYEVLLWLADDLIRRGQDHRSEQPMARDAAARHALVYLNKAENAYPPTHALYVLRAHCHEALSDDGAAQADTQRAAQAGPTIAFDHFLVGQAAFDANNLTEGARAFEMALRVEPTHYWSLMMLGKCGFGSSQPSDRIAAAAHILTGCILKRPDHAYAYYCRACAYQNLDRKNEAVADYSKAIELGPRNAAAWHFRGQLYAQLGQRDRALADYTKAVELDPQHAYAWFGRGNTHAKLGQTAQALADFSQAIELNPNFVSARVNRGRIYRQTGQHDKSLLDYSKAVELNPKSLLAWYGRGLLYADLRQHEKAVAEYSRAIELNPRYAAAWFARGLSHERSSRPTQALSDYSQSIELDPTFATAWFARGGIYKWLNQPEKALADQTKVTELAPQFASTWHARAETLNRLNKHQEAIADYSRAIEVEPTKAPSINNLAWLLATCPDETLRDVPRAVELATKATQLLPKEGTYWNTLGVAHYRNGDWMSAIAALDKAIELRDGGDASERLFQAMSHWQLGHREEAGAAYEQALSWLEKNQKLLEKRTPYRDELRRFQAEAEELLGRRPWD